MFGFRIINSKTSNTETRETMYVLRKVEAHACNQFCSAKEIRISYHESVLVALGIQHAMLMRHIVMMPAQLYNFSPHCRKV